MQWKRTALCQKLKETVSGKDAEVMTTSRFLTGKVQKEDEELITLRNPKEHGLD